MARPALPDFDRPPLDEVALGVKFVEIYGFSEAHIGLLWQELRGDYPQVESHQRLQMNEDPFDKRIEPKASLVVDMPRSGRTWFVTSDSVYLVQIQADALFVNWRKRAGTEYPHFEEILNRFQNVLTRFKIFLHNEGFSLPTFQMAEVSYINWIPRMQPHEFMKVGESGILPTAFSGEPEIQVWLAKYPIRDDDGVGVGRMTIAGQSAARPNGDALDDGSQLTLTVRRKVDARGDELPEVALLARSLIVQAFDYLTTEQAHTIWQRK